jgi:hypothetical protein
VSYRLVALFLCALFLNCVRGIAVPFVVINICKGERLQLVEIPHKRETTIRKKTVVFK